jgi:hypothetical protein
MNYLGARENGPPVQNQQALTPAAWQGIVGLIQTMLRTARFAEDFPDRACVDPGLDQAITGSNEQQFYLRVRGEHPNILTPLNPEVVPDTIAALELVEFCFRKVSMPVAPEAHEFYMHRHYLHFRRAAGQEEFVGEVNEILVRNHLAFELQPNGEVRRLLPPVLREALQSAVFTSEDDELNQLLESARRKFIDPDFRVRYDALRDLWRAFERMKTLEEPRNDVQRSCAALIARVSQEPLTQQMLEREMRVELAEFGNGFFIRHANAGQVLLQTSEEIDYLFHRLFAVIRWVLRSTNRCRE